jgi:acetyltransferase
LLARGSKLAPLSETTIEKLNGLLPKGWSGGNPVEILVDAPPSRYSDALRVLAEDKSIDAVLALHAPTALTSNEEIAKAIVQTARKHGANLLTSWVGEESVAAARRHFVESGLPTFESPSAAVRAFLHMVKHRRNMEMLMQTPPSSPTDFRPDIPAARAVIDKALADGRSILSEPEAKEILSAFGMPTTPTRIVASPEEAEKIADEIGYPIALTILSPDITRKWDVGGVALTLENAEAVRAACQGMITRLEERSPGARHTGFTVQRMVPRKNARQLIIGVATDPLFGPVILFGEGGRAIEVIRDHAVALPPLNVALAKELIGRTRVSALLEAYHDRPAADLDAIALALMQVSQIVIDLPEIIEIDVNPLFADNKGVMVVDAHMRITPAPQGPGRLAIRPYPKELEEEAQLKDGRKIMLRPIRPEDEPAHHVMVARMSPEDLRMRFFNYVTELPHSQMARLTQIDYEREMAFIATLFNEMGEPETLAVVRTVTDPDNLRAEFAVAVRSDMKGQGLGRLLMEKIVRHAKARGTNEIAGDILAENKNMLALAGRLGFVVGKPDEDNVVKVVCSLL